MHGVRVLQRGGLRRVAGLRVTTAASSSWHRPLAAASTPLPLSRLSLPQQPSPYRSFHATRVHATSNAGDNKPSSTSSHPSTPPPPSFRARRDSLGLGASEAAILTLIHSLPIFTHTGPEVDQDSPLDSSRSTHQRLHHGWLNGMWRNVKYAVMLPMQLGRYVDPGALDIGEMFHGCSGALDCFVYGFNNFHEENARKMLRKVCSKRVYEAMEKSHKMLEENQLRMVYKAYIRGIQLVDLHIHDSTDWSEGGGGGGGGLTVPVEATPPLSSAPDGPPPPPPTNMSRNDEERSSKRREENEEATMRMSSPTPSSNQSSSSSSSSSSSVPKTDPPPRRIVRYADLDVRYVLYDVFELHSTVPLDDKSAASASSTGAAAATASVSSAMDSYLANVARRFEDKDGDGAGKTSPSDINEQARAIHAAINEIRERVLKTESEALKLKLDDTKDEKQDEQKAPTSAPSPAKETESQAATPSKDAASTSSSTSTTSSSSSSSNASSTDSSSSSSPSASTPSSSDTSNPDPNYLFTISGHGFRGLRFTTQLTRARADDEEWMTAVAAKLKGQTLPAHIKLPTPQWTIKDILD